MISHKSAKVIRTLPVHERSELTICRNFDLNQSRESRSQNQSRLSKYDSRLSLSRTLSTASKSRSCPLSKPETTRDPVRNGLYM